MKAIEVPKIADLPCAFLTTSKDRAIISANPYFLKHFGWDAECLTGASITTLFTRASQLFCDSYVYPKAIAERVCKEVQLTVLTSTGTRRPVVANVKSLLGGGFAWAFIEAENRNSLFEELEAAREVLQEQREQLENLSRTDGLTGVLNRRGLDEETARVFAEAERHGQPVTILMMDIDHFKSINDVHGHQVGDDALIFLGDILKSVCRDQDLVGRFGGDEFACVLNHTDVKDASSLATRIHEAVAARSGAHGGFTVSIGVSCRTNRRPLSYSEVLSQADKALYEAKAAGRNTTFVLDPGRDAQAPQAGLIENSNGSNPIDLTF